MLRRQTRRHRLFRSSSHPMATCTHYGRQLKAGADSRSYDRGQREFRLPPIDEREDYGERMSSVALGLAVHLGAKLPTSSRTSSRWNLEQFGYSPGGFGASLKPKLVPLAAPHMAQSDVSAVKEPQGRYSHLLYADSGILAVCAGDDCFEPSPIPPPECYFGCCNWPMQPICSIGAAFLYQYAASPDSNVNESVNQSLEQLGIWRTVHAFT